MTALPNPFIALPRPTKAYHMEPYPAIAPLRPELNLQGKTVLITGGATGIGLATSWAFAQAGVIILAIMARSEAQMAKAKKEIEAKHPGTQVKTCAASVTDAVAVDDFIKGLGVIDILILNAGVARAPSSVVDTNSDDLVNDFSINVFGNFNVLKAYLALPPRSADAKRTVVYTSTAGAYMAQPGFGAYSASKMAMSQLVRHVALEEANKGVRVFTIHPAATLTDMAKTVGFKEGQIQFDAVDLPAQYAVWLCSPEADFLQGKFLWSHWDVDELKAKKEQIASDPFSLNVGMHLGGLVE